MRTIEYKGNIYPAFQSEGNASQFAIPFAKHFIKDGMIGYDIGCGKWEWKLDGAMAIDPVLDPEWHAMKLPDREVNFIFSSHCLEHIENPWFDVLEYWTSKLTWRGGGILFLYLPHPSQEYWLPWNNRKHKHILHPEDLKNAFEALELKNIFVSGVDLNNSFMIVGEK